MLAAGSARAKAVVQIQALCWSSHSIPRSFAVAAGKTGEADEGEVKAAREWLSGFTPETIPKNISEVTFSRSSGPGGQNVNKVNSKATLKVPLHSLLRLVPTILHPEIRASRFCKQNSDAIIIQADEYRKQADNAQSCYTKLHNIITEAASRKIPGETSDRQKTRVKGLQHAANEHRLQQKKAQTMKKAARKGGSSKKSDGW